MRIISKQLVFEILAYLYFMLLNLQGFSVIGRRKKLKKLSYCLDKVRTLMSSLPHNLATNGFICRVKQHEWVIRVGKLELSCLDTNPGHLGGKPGSYLSAVVTTKMSNFILPKIANKQDNLWPFISKFRQCSVILNRIKPGYRRD